MSASGPYVPSPLMSPPLLRTRTRSSRKCDFCRIKKRKCTPENRDWESAGQRCNGCITGGQPCGPNLHHDESITTSSRHTTPSIPRTIPYTPPSLPSNSFMPLSPSTAGEWSDYVAMPGAAAHQWSPDGQPEESLYAESSDLQTRRPRVASFNGQNVHKGVPGSKAKITAAVIRTKIIELGNLRDLYRYLKSRRQASEQVQPTRPFSMFSEIESVLATTIHCARRQFEYTSTYTHDLIAQAGQDRELFLRRLFDVVGDFLSISAWKQASLADDKDKDVRIEQLHRQLAEHLIDFYQASKEYSEADQFRLRLAVLQQQHQIPQNDFDRHQEAEAFLGVSGRVSAAFAALDLPRHCSRLLPSIQNVFPAAHLATCSGRPATALGLLADPCYQTNQLDLLKRRTEHIAVETRDSALLQASIKRSLESEPQRDLDAQRDLYHMTPLCLAACLGDLGIFRALFDAGHSVDAQDIAGRNVLCVASGSGHIEIVQFLLDRGCIPNTYNLDQGRSAPHDSPRPYSALHAAAAGNYAKIVELLLKAGAYPLLESHDRTPSQEALAFGHHELAAVLAKAEKEELATIQTNAAKGPPRSVFAAMSDSTFTPSSSSSRIPERQPETLRSSTTSLSSSARSSPHPTESTSGPSVSATRKRRHESSGRSTPDSRVASALLSSSRAMRRSRTQTG